MSRDRRWLLLLAGVLLLAMVLWTIPARVLPWLLGDQPLRLSGLGGTLWRGEAARAVLVLPSGTLHLGALRWRLEPASLASFSPRIAVDSQWGQQRLAMRVRRSGSARYSLRDVSASVDARLAQQWIPVALRGRFDAQLARLEVVDDIPVAVHGTLTWQSAGWFGPTGPRSLGSYLAQLSTTDEGSIVATVSTLAGALRAEGTVTLDAGRYAVDARLDPQGPVDPELEQALSLVAVPDENGYLLRLNGALVPPR